MTAIIDGTLTYTDLSDYYTPSPDGTPLRHTSPTPFENLQPAATPSRSAYGIPRAT